MTRVLLQWGDGTERIAQVLAIHDDDSFTLLLDEKCRLYRYGDFWFSETEPNTPVHVQVAP